MPNGQEPVTSAMIDYIISQAEDKNEDSLEAAMRDWVILGQFTGCHLSEWAQDARYANKGIFATNTIEDGGDGLARAFTIDDFTILADNDYNFNHVHWTIIKEEDVKSINVRWRYQKNGDNGQKIKFISNKKNPKRCPVRAA
eukprot:13137667-Ditylum_brightwellii.AAC.1